MACSTDLINTSSVNAEELRNNSALRAAKGHFPEVFGLEPGRFSLRARSTDTFTPEAGT
jgi:hypothetical protein